MAEYKKESRKPSLMGRDEPLIGEDFNQKNFVERLKQVLKNRGVNLDQNLSSGRLLGDYDQGSLEAKMLKDNPALTPEKLERLLRSN